MCVHVCMCTPGCVEWAGVPVNVLFYVPINEGNGRRGLLGHEAGKVGASSLLTTQEKAPGPDCLKESKSLA